MKENEWKTNFRKLWASITKENQHLTTERIEDLFEQEIEKAEVGAYNEGAMQMDSNWRMAIVHLNEKERNSVISTLEEIEKMFPLKP